jgi:hypothetical protein
MWHRNPPLILRGFLPFFESVPNVTFAGQLLAHVAVGIPFTGLQCGQTIDVAIVHTERCRDQHGIVDLFVGRALLLCARDVFARHAFPSLLTLPAMTSKPSIVGNSSGLRIHLNLFHQIIVAPEMRGGRGTMGELAKVAFISIGDMRRNHFPLG